MPTADFAIKDRVLTCLPPSPPRLHWPREVIRVPHFHLKYFRRTRQGQINYGAVFHSQMDALNAAGLANATRDKDPGYYGIEECRRASCENPRTLPGVAGQKRRPAVPRKGFLPPSKMLN